MINAFNNKALREIRKQIESWLICDIQPTTFPATYQLTRKQIDEIVGTYEAITERFP